MTLQGTIWLGVASGVISFIISEALIFKPFREWVKGKSEFFCNLVHCILCTSVWVSFTLEAIYRPNLFNKIPGLDHILTAFIIALVSTITGLIIDFMMKITDK